eukprot:4137766-Prymnesium_polylepis.1
MQFPYTSDFCGIWSRCELTAEVGRMSDAGRLESFLRDSWQARQLYLVGMAQSRSESNAKLLASPLGRQAMVWAFTAAAVVAAASVAGSGEGAEGYGGERITR